ncbi:hypothetical protein L484_007128 [Morus notabilis]|uniref:Uncharacterized protein n=1 Tax=Morus notabilis TaxID=981085 RepID=W9RTS0_9ROSA|nr:hypothetical protein L484_007128 [Morus notabilis]
MAVVATNGGAASACGHDTAEEAGWPRTGKDPRRISTYGYDFCFFLPNSLFSLSLKTNTGILRHRPETIFAKWLAISKRGLLEISACLVISDGFARSPEGAKPKPNQFWNS